MIRFPCGTCGRRLRVPARLAGKRGRCERCGAVNRVPLADVPPESPAPATPVSQPSPASPPPRPSPAPAAPSVESGASEEWADRSPDPAIGNGEAHDVSNAAATEPASASPAPVEAAAIPEINFVDDVPSDDDVPDAAATPGEAAAADASPVETADAPLPANLADVDKTNDRRPPAAGFPPVLAVDVRRAEGPSPFRSTADVTARETIEGTVNLREAQFAAAGRPIAVVEGADANRTVENFLEVVSRRIGVVGRPESIGAAAALPAAAAGGYDPDDDGVPPMRILHVDVDVIEDDTPPAAPAWRPPHAAPAAPPQRLERGPVIVALLVGLILGFCAGLLASEWL